MAHIYIALVDTPGFFAALIRRFIKQRYIHVVLGFDAELREAYSVGRRNPAIPMFAGFDAEECAVGKNTGGLSETISHSLCGLRTAFYFGKAAFLHK